MKAKIFLLFVIFIVLLTSLSCQMGGTKVQLSAEEEEFLSKTQYIITSEEKDIFLSLSSAERQNFIQEFWKKRDPDPDTEENEFKEQYFTRIEEANKFFGDRGKEGWLQDRGRIYIQLGPPDQREAYPTGQTFYGLPMEIWYYGFYPIVFIDRYKDGTYRLEPMSARNITEITRATEELKPKITDEEKADFDFDFEIDIKSIGENRALVQVSIPYRKLWLSSQDDQLKTSLILSLEIYDSSEQKIWDLQENYPISIKEDELLKFEDTKYIIETSVELKPGNYTLIINLKNTTDQRKASKRANFRIKASSKS